MTRRIYRGFDIYKDDPSHDVEGFYEPLHKKMIEFKDEFAPSTVDIETPDKFLQFSQHARFEHYNDHLMDREIDRLMNEAFSLGCAEVPYTTLLQGTPFSSDHFSEAIKSVAILIEQFEEYSDEWLILQYYYRWVSACFAASIGLPAVLQIDHFLAVGAIMKEIELSANNKHDSLVRKNQKKSLAHHNDGRYAYNSNRKAAAKEWKIIAEKLAKESILKGNARAMHIATHLKNHHGIIRSAKTIANYFTGR